MQFPATFFNILLRSHEKKMFLFRQYNNFFLLKQKLSLEI